MCKRLNMNSWRWGAVMGGGGGTKVTLDGAREVELMNKGFGV